jgi:hypothetical protein
MPRIASTSAVQAKTMLTTLHSVFSAPANCRRASSSQRRTMLLRQSQQATDLHL